MLRLLNIEYHKLRYSKSAKVLDHHIFYPYNFHFPHCLHRIQYWGI